MLKGTPQKEYIKTLSEIFNIANEELDILGLGANDLRTTKKPRKFTSLDFMRQINDVKLIKGLCMDLGIKSGYSLTSIIDALPELSMEDIANNNVFIATEENGDRVQVVLLLKES